MTSLLSDRPSADPLADLRHRRPLVLVATLGGAGAAASTLVVCLAVGVTGWFAADAGAHGAPRDALRVGALGWLTAHGSGVRIQGTPVGLVPLGLSVLCAWVVWRLGRRVGESVSGHGPDADRIADGERDWTVPAATLLYAAGYAVVTALTAALATTDATGVSAGRALAWSVLLCLAVGGPAVAAGSGRLAIWTASWPAGVPAALSAGRRILSGYLAAALLVFAVALLADAATAANVLAQLKIDTGDQVTYALASLLLVPNAVLFTGSYLLGPGFTIGTGTLVTSSGAALGALPLFPLLAALPDAGPAPAWAAWLPGLLVLVAGVGAARAQRRHPTTGWLDGALRGCAGGLLAALLVAAVTALAGGAAGPGRMQEVGAPAGSVLVHALPELGLGGLAGGLLMTAWQRRRARPATTAD